MLGKCLAFWIPGFLELIIISIIGLVVYVLPILLVILIILSLVRNKRENQRLRVEVGKLADEVQQIRKQMEDNQSEDSQT